jgi:glycosyltransferase involved in cell wall biosynthesis
MRKDKPLVSIIIPNYNHADYLEERIRSILNQTYTNYEIIILDDRSTDNSIEIINKFRDNSHISNIIINEENSGSPFKQWFKGISLAKGDLIWIAECDDSCELCMLERLVDTYLKYNCVYAFSRSMVIDSKGTKQYISQRHFKTDIHLNGDEFIRKFLCISNTVRNASSAIFSKKAALSIDKDFMTYNESGDWMFWMEMARLGNVAVISSPLNFFRQYPETNTSRASKKGLTDIEDKRIFDYMIANKLISNNKIFIKRKRMAKKLLFYDAYENEEVKLNVKKAWNIPSFYFVISYFSFIYHKLFK